MLVVGFLYTLFIKLRKFSVLPFSFTLNTLNYVKCFLTLIDSIVNFLLCSVNMKSTLIDFEYWTSLACCNKPTWSCCIICVYIAGFYLLKFSEGFLHFYWWVILVYSILFLLFFSFLGTVILVYISCRFTI